MSEMLVPSSAMQIAMEEELQVAQGFSSATFLCLVTQITRAPRRRKVGRDEETVSPFRLSPLQADVCSTQPSPLQTTCEAAWRIGR